MITTYDLVGRHRDRSTLIDSVIRVRAWCENERKIADLCDKIDVWLDRASQRNTCEDHVQAAHLLLDVLNLMKAGQLCVEP